MKEAEFFQWKNKTGKSVQVTLGKDELSRTVIKDFLLFLFFPELKNFE